MREAATRAHAQRSRSRSQLTQRARRRNRRRRPALRQVKTTRRVLEPHKWRWQRNRARRTDHVDLRRPRFDIRFLFGIFACVHGVTKRAGMRAIESLSDGLAQRRVLRVFNHHRSPRDRLKRDPMQTNRAAEREDRHDPADTANHATRLVSRLTNVNQ